MASFKIEGGHLLSGEIRPQGAKNEALQVICATLLTSEAVTIHNIPNIRDVNNLIQLLKDIGVKVKPTTNPSQKDGCGFTFQADTLNMDFLESDEFVEKCAQLRGSVMMIGPLLARMGKAVIAKPGGDKIGRRRLDTHFLGFQKLGAKFRQIKNRDVYELFAKRLKGAYMLLDEASVTGTANIIMAATMAEGTTTIYNAACEPYIQQLCHMLSKMGAKISGIGSNLLTIEGVKTLQGADHTLLPDMIEVGSFIGMAAMCGNGVRIKDCSLKDLGIIPDAFRRLGVKVEEEGDDLYIPHQKHYVVDSFIDGTIMTLADAPWPGLTPDLLSVLIVVATQGSRLCAVPPEDVRESSVLRRPTDRHGCTDYSLRPPPCCRGRSRPPAPVARQQDVESRYPCRYRPADSCHECQRHQPHQQHRTDRPRLRKH